MRIKKNIIKGGNSTWHIKEKRGAILSISNSEERQLCSKHFHQSSLVTQLEILFEYLVMYVLDTERKLQYAYHIY